MVLKFENMKELKFFILHSDVAEWARNEPLWGGIGLIVTNDLPEKPTLNDVRTWDSAVYKGERGDVVIATPYARELSWLLGMMIQSCELDSINIRDIAEMSCKGFFIGHPEGYDAKELLLFVVDFVEGVITRTHANNGLNSNKGI